MSNRPNQNLSETAAGNPPEARPVAEVADPPSGLSQAEHGPLNRTAVAGFFAVWMVFGGVRPAEAASTGDVLALPPEITTNWNVYIPLALSVLTAFAAIKTIRNQTRVHENTGLRTALQDIKGETKGEERLARLNALAPFAESSTYAPEVYRAVLAYLRGRRGGLIELQNKYKGRPDELEAAITDRRNADRTAFGLLLETLPEFRKRQERRELMGRITRLLRKGGDDLALIDELTGLQAGKLPLVNARGICMDDMRGEVRGCSLRGVDLTGAGLQRNEIKRVSFAGARLCEAQLEGSRVSHCDLRGTDLRAAYFGDKKYAVIESCIIDENTKFGNLPDDHPDSKVGYLEPDRADGYRGIPNVVLKDLCSRTLSTDQIVELVHEWQRLGLRLMPGSGPRRYYLPQ